MNKRIGSLLLALLMLLAVLAGCGLGDTGAVPDGTRAIPSAAGTPDSGEPPEEAEPDPSAPQAENHDQAEAAVLDPDGAYTSPMDVADYLHTYGQLPKNFLTKSEARALGWDSSAGNLWDVAPGMSIGGDYFGNYEGRLPEGEYRECDVNYAGGYRGGERLIYGEDGSIYYTADHYESFQQLY